MTPRSRSASPTWCITAAAWRAESKRALIITDMPFMSYQQSPPHAFASAGRLMQKGGAQVVKLEGGEPMAETVRFLVERGVPVCAHLGLTPQSVHQLGGYRVQGREATAAERIRHDAKVLQDAGASLLVLEAVPSELAKTITLGSGDSHHRHRRRPGLRRPGAGAARHARHLSAAEPQVLEKFHARRGQRRSRGQSLHRRRQIRRIPRPGAQLSVP